MGMDCHFTASTDISYRGELVEAYEKVELDRCDSLRIALAHVTRVNINLKTTHLDVRTLDEVCTWLSRQTTHRLGWCNSVEELLQLLTEYRRVLSDGGVVTFDCWY